jgi:drug/metabolite transporter (DMT)-like permease
VSFLILGEVVVAKQVIGALLAVAGIVLLVK